MNRMFFFIIFKFNFLMSYFQWVIFNVVKDFVVYMKTILIRQALYFGHEWQSTYIMRKYSDYRVSQCVQIEAQKPLFKKVQILKLEKQRNEEIRIRQK